MPRPSLPEDLQPLDRMMHLWAAGGDGVGPRSGGIHPLELIRQMQEGAFIGGCPVPEPAELKQIDEILKDAPPQIAMLLKTWYRNDWAVRTKADRLGISRTGIYLRWKEALRYLQGAMRERNVHCIA